MSHNRAHDLLLLLACGMPAACGPATEPAEGSGSGGGGDNGADVENAIDACGAWATKQTACFEESGTSGGYTYYGYGGSYLSNLGYCFLYLGYGDSNGPGCRGAIEDHFACLATLDCDELGVVEVSDDSGGSTGPEPEPPCAMQQAAVEAQCDISDGDDADVDFETSGG